MALVSALIVDLFTKALEVFNCTPNDLLPEREYLNYDD